MHELGDGGGEVPPVNIVQVDIGRTEALERDIDVEVKGLESVPIEEVLLLDLRIVQIWVVGVLS